MTKRKASSVPPQPAPPKKEASQVALEAALAVLAAQGIETDVTSLQDFSIVEGVAVSVVLADYRKIIIQWADLPGRDAAGPPETDQAK